MKAAFDKVKRKTIWKRMKKEGISKKLRGRIKRIYSRTKCVIRIGDEIGQEFEVKPGLRLGCLLSQILHNLVFANLVKEMEEWQEGGKVIGRRKIWTIGYADDLVLLATNEKGLSEMLKRLEGYLEIRGLEVNVK